MPDPYVGTPGMLYAHGTGASKTQEPTGWYPTPAEEKLTQGGTVYLRPNGSLQLQPQSVWSGTNVDASGNLPPWGWSNQAGQPFISTAGSSIMPYTASSGGGGGSGLSYEQALGLKAAMSPGGGAGATAGAVGGVVSGAGVGGYSAGGLSNYPGWNQLSAMSQGQLSPGAVNMIQQQAAERGISTGLPGAPATNASYLRALGLTAEDEIMKAQSIISPLYQQQVSEAGQTGRLGMSLAAQMEQLVYSTNAQERMQGAKLAADAAIAQMQEAGLDQRQAAALGSAMQQLIVSQSAQDRRQASDLAAAMDRLKIGAANDLDKLKIQQATQLGLAQLEQSGAYSRAALQSATQLGTVGLENLAQMDRLKYSTTAQQQEYFANLLQQQQLATQQQALQKYIADQQTALGYYSAMTRPQYGLGAGRTGGQTGGQGQSGGQGQANTIFTAGTQDLGPALINRLPAGASGTGTLGSNATPWYNLGGNQAYNPATGEVLDMSLGGIDTGGRGLMYMGPSEGSTEYDPWLEELAGLGY